MRGSKDCMTLWLRPLWLTVSLLQGDTVCPVSVSVSLCLCDITKHIVLLSVLLINTSLWWHSCAPSLSISLSCPVMYIIISKHNLVLVLVIVNTKSKAVLAFSQLCSFQVQKIILFWRNKKVSVLARGHSRSCYFSLVKLDHRPLRVKDNCTKYVYTV